MNIDLFKHWIPDLRQTKNKNAWVASKCPCCGFYTKSKSFRINTKLKVWKCFQCGRGGKTFGKFVHYLKKRDLLKLEIKYLKKISRRPKVSLIEEHYGCSTYYESTLPF